MHFVTHEEAETGSCRWARSLIASSTWGRRGWTRFVAFLRSDREALASCLDFEFRAHNLLVTFHPVTLAGDLGMEQLEELMQALDGLGEKFGILITGPNADAAGRAVMKRLMEFAASHAHAKVYTSLGQQLYYSAITQVDAVVGNSSSGLYEVPSFHKPTVDIGERQRGRVAAASVIHANPRRCRSRRPSSRRRRWTVRNRNPYGDGESVERIMAVLRRPTDGQSCYKSGLTGRRRHDLALLLLSLRRE